MRKVFGLDLFMIFVLTSAVCYAGGSVYIPHWQESAANAPTVRHTNVFIVSEQNSNAVTLTAYRMDGTASITTTQTLNARESWAALGASWITGLGFDTGTKYSGEKKQRQVIYSRMGY